MAEARRASRSTVVRSCSAESSAGAQDFQHHGPLQQRVVGKINDAAAARSEFAENLVMFDGSSLHLLQVYVAGL